MRLIDAKAAEKVAKELCANNPCLMGLVLRIIRKIPTIEAEPIVRCKDCKWYYEKGALCNYWADVCEHAEVYPQISPIDFCSRGERKDEVEE